MNRARLLQLLPRAERSKLVSDIFILPKVRMKCLESPFCCLTTPVGRRTGAGAQGEGLSSPSPA